MILRAIRPADLDGVFEIYDDEVLHGTSTFDTEPYGANARQRWLAKHQSARYPAFIAETDDGTVAAWATLSPYSDRKAYDRTAETSVYVHKNHRRRGIARALVELVVSTSRELGLKVLIAKITSESTASLARGAPAPDASRPQTAPSVASSPIRMAAMGRLPPGRAGRLRYWRTRS
jgi:phosphinothricin acetyltransferase